MSLLNERRSLRTALVAGGAAVVVALVIGVGLVGAGSGEQGPEVPVGGSGLPTSAELRGAIRSLAFRLHRVPDLALIQLEPGLVRFQYYGDGQGDRGAFINYRNGKFGNPEPFEFPVDFVALRFDPAELQPDGVEAADRIRHDLGLGAWRIMRAEGYRRGQTISDGSGIVWRITLEHNGELRYMIMNQGGRFLRIAKGPA